MALLNEYIIVSCDADSVELALDEVAKVAAATVAAELVPGVLLLQSERSFGRMSSSWRELPPIFVRHKCAVQAIVALANGPDDAQNLAEQVSQSWQRRAETEAGEQNAVNLDWAGFDAARSFSVQTRIFAETASKPYDVNMALSTALHAASGAPVDVRSPEQVLSVAIVPGDLLLSDETAASPAPLYALLGLSQVEENLSSWAGGMRRFAREFGQVSRAEFKLLEALEVFQIALPEHGVALDLGASPGGWTRVLRQQGQYVTAIDPGELDPRVAADSGVRHKRMTAEEYLQDEPDTFDLIVNDMRMDARDSARLMVQYAAQLYSHGFAIMTLKLPETRRAPIIEHTFKILRGAYLIAGARQLFHNRSEITLHLERRVGLDRGSE